MNNPNSMNGQKPPQSSRSLGSSVPTAPAPRAGLGSKPNPSRPQRKPPRPSSSANPLVQRRPPRPNPALVQKKKPPRPPPPTSGRPLPAGMKSLEELRRKYGGWSGPAPAGAVDYPLVITKRDLKAGVRFHVMRFQAVADKNDKVMMDGTRSVDPSDPNQFTRPVTLSRRDPRQPPIGIQLKDQAQQRQQKQVPEPPTDEEAARIATAKAEREAQRAHDLAQIAPVAKDPNAAAKKAAKKAPKETKYTPVFRRPDEAFQKESELRYEESLPWHLEDADGKNVWVGSYVGALSENHAALVIDGSNIRMIPLQKYYAFKAKPPFTPYSIEQAENIMNKKADVGRWAMLEQERLAKEKEMVEARRILWGPSMIKGESATFKGSSRSEKVEHDELDMSGDEFQDDDEQPTLDRDEDEDAREAQDKIRRDQLGANLFGKANEQEVEAKIKEEEDDEMERKILGKAVRRMLLKREKEAIYATDSDDDPFASSSEEEEEDSPKEDDAKIGDAKPGDPKPGATSKQPAGSQPTVAPAKGSTTPSGKKPSESLKKGKKRPGSPTLSDASGNETGGSVSRKKLKRAVATGSARPSRASTPLPPGPSPPQSSNMAATPAALSGFNANTTASNGEAVTTASTSPNATLTREEVLAAVPSPPGGITIGELVKSFPGRIGDGPGKVPKPVFIRMVKEVTTLGADKLLRRKA